MEANSPDGIDPAAEFLLIRHVDRQTRGGVLIAEDRGTTVPVLGRIVKRGPGQHVRFAREMRLVPIPDEYAVGRGVVFRRHSGAAIPGRAGLELVKYENVLGFIELDEAE